MKILLIQPTGDKFGHYGTYFTNVAQELCSLGHNVTIYTNKMDIKTYLKENSLFELAEYENGKYTFRHFEENKIASPLRYWLNYFWLSFKITRTGLKYAAVNGFDVIYISDAEFLMAAIALMLNSKQKKPTLMQINASNFSFQEYPGSFIKKSYKAFQTFWFSKALRKYLDGISVLGEWHYTRLKKQLNLPTNFKIFKIPDGATQNIDLTPKYLARRKIDIDYEGDVLLFSGILRVDKGLEVLAKAIGELFNAGENFRLIVAGHPFDYSEIQVEKLFNFGEHHKDKIILHLKYIAEEEIGYYFCSADALLLPYNSKYKGSTGPLMKGACTFGLPLILSNQGEMGALATNNDLGFLFKTENAYSLAEAIRCFLRSDQGERLSKRQNAFQLGQLNSWQTVALAFEDAFLSIISISENWEINNEPT